MDSFAGEPTDPLSLHKYLYAKGSPVEYTDPSGLMGLGGTAELNATLSMSQVLAANSAMLLHGVETAVVVATEEVGAVAVVDSAVVIGISTETACALAFSFGLAVSIISHTVLDDKPEERQQRVLFGQRRAGPSFSTDDDVPPNISGRTIDAVVADLRTGHMKSDDIPIFAFKDKASGQLVSANTRGLAALSKAGMKPTNVIVIEPHPKLLGRLRENGGKNLLGDPMPSVRVPITPSRYDNTVLEVITIPN
jgi:hypothetical protein